MKKKYIFFLIPFLFCVQAVAKEKPCDIYGIEKDAPLLCGVAQQGGMLYGNSDGWQVYDGNKKISKNGFFVVGLDRDAPDIQKLTFCMPGKALASGVCKTYSYKIVQRKYQEQKITVPSKFVKYPPEVEKRIAMEAAAIKKARDVAAKDTALYFMKFRIPENLNKYRISGVFGSARVFNGEVKNPHKGTDWAAPVGTPVYSFAPGRVILAESHYLNGNIVILAHGHNITTTYLHLDKISVKVGDAVGMDTKLGTVGATGRTSGPHLHAQGNFGSVAIDIYLIAKGT